MKYTIQILLALALLVSNSFAATVTGRAALTTAAGTEKVPIDDGGVDKYILISNIWKGMVLSGGLTASGSTAFDFSGSTGAFKTSTGVNTFGGSSNVFTNALLPSANDGAALGSTSYQWSDLFLASGAVLNWNNGNVVLTHSNGLITVSTGNLKVTTQGTVSGSVDTIDGVSTLTNKTLTSAVLNGATSASGNFDLSGSSGTFKSNTGANTLGGAVTVNAATTPSLTTAAGKTNSGFVLLNGKTSGGLKLLPTDASGYTLTVQNAAVATADRTLTLPDPGGSDSVTYNALAASLTNKTLVSAVISTGLTASGSAANTFAGSTGTFITSTGANTLSGAVTITDATTPSLTTAASKTLSLIHI